MPGCRGNSEAPARRVYAGELDPAQPGPAPAPAPGHTLSAAGVEFTVPLSWTVVEENEPMFAMAWGRTDDPSHVSLCTIEVRRQGPATLPPGIQRSPSSSADVTDYTHGPVRGRLRELPGPTASASVLVHCRAHRSSGQWGAIEAGFDSMKTSTTPPELSPLNERPSDTAIVELCVSSPARQTMVCARRADGAVYCGPSTGEVLHKIEDILPAKQLSCERTRICTRDADGQVSCWRTKQAPAQLPLDTPARDIAGGCVVDARGLLSCRQRNSDGSPTDTLTELLPLGESKYALTGVHRVLAGSDEDHGCVLRRVDSSMQLWCWDRAPQGTLGLDLLDPGHPQRVDVPGISDAAGAGPLALATIGGRVCVGTAGEWTCLTDGSSVELDGCERRVCGCSLVGATRMSCDDAPNDRIDSRVFGRISDVVATAGACAARLDGTVICRGPVTGRVDDDARVLQAVAGGVPGIAHVLELL